MDAWGLCASARLPGTSILAAWMDWRRTREGFRSKDRQSADCELPGGLLKFRRGSRRPSEAAFPSLRPRRRSGAG